MVVYFGNFFVNFVYTNPIQGDKNCCLSRSFQVNGHNCSFASLNFILWQLRSLSRQYPGDFCTQVYPAASCIWSGED